MLVPLDDAETALLREMLETQARDLRHEIHYTDSPDYKEQLRTRLSLVEDLLRKVPNIGVRA